MQRLLIEGLCGLPQGTVVNQAWLEEVWSVVPTDWIRRFLENDSGNRAEWMSLIAASSLADKESILRFVREQLRFGELYHDPPTIRLTRQRWERPALDAANKLLKSFYDPLFYKSHKGFQNSGDVSFHKDHFISGFNPPVRICPYTDNYIQDTKLDHFLPKDHFPMLSCHPDNLIPCSTDSNSGSHKGTQIPLDLNQDDQAENWFHPRWHSAANKYRLEFPPSTLQPTVSFIALAAHDQTRLNNMVRMFGLRDFWGTFLDDEVQSVASDVQGWLQDDGKRPSEENVRYYVLRLARQEKKRIGRDGLAIVKSFFYEHIAQTPVLLAQIVRTCSYGM